VCLPGLLRLTDLPTVSLTAPKVCCFPHTAALEGVEAADNLTGHIPDEKGKVRQGV
jgi:hypothetical protein